MNKFREYSLSKKTDELKRLISENPNLPIVVLAGEEANSGDYNWMFCANISFELQEILDCDYLDYNDTVFTDRDRLEERISEDLLDEYQGRPEEDYNAAVLEKVAALEPFWKKVIAIFANN